MMKNLNHAKDEPGLDARTPPVQGGQPGPVRTPADAEFLHRTAPSRQRQAKAFLDGKSPGIMQFYAPDAMASDVEGWIEGDDTVHRLVSWRQFAIY